MKKILENKETEVLIVDNFEDLSWEIGKFGRNVLWVFDSNTSLMVRPLPEPNVILQAGRQSRKFDSVLRILDEAYDSKMGKDSIFLAFGGRSVADVTAFASSVWMYSSRFVNVPTTLSSFLDSSIGSKHGIDYKTTKDCVGICKAPEKTIICLNLLKSLSSTNYSNGLACMIKYALLSESTDLNKYIHNSKNLILNRDLNALQKIIEMSLKVRMSHLDNGNEKFLSIGSVFANILTNLYADKFSDGQALAWGIVTSARIAASLDICTVKYAETVSSVFADYGFITDFKINRSQWNELRSLLISEKYYTDGKITLILPVSQGNLKIVSVDEIIIQKQVFQNALL